MNTLARRLIGLAVTLAAAAYVGITHSKAFETYVKDRAEQQDEVTNHQLSWWFGYAPPGLITRSA